jgi:hypothetical protein
MDKDYFKTILIFKLFLNNLSGRVMREWIGEMNSKGISVKDQIKEYERIIMLMEVKINFLKNIKEELIRDIPKINIKEEDELLTIPQVLNKLHLKSKQTLQNYNKKGVLKPVIISSGIGKTDRGRTLYKKSDIDKFISER